MKTEFLYKKEGAGWHSEQLRGFRMEERRKQTDGEQRPFPLENTKFAVRSRGGLSAKGSRRGSSKTHNY